MGRRSGLAPHGAALGAVALGRRASHGRALPVHGGRGAAPRAPALAPEEALLKVRGGRRTGRARRAPDRRARLAVADARVGRRVARLVGAAPLILHGRGRERYDLVETERYPVLPLALVHLLAALALCNGAGGESIGRRGARACAGRRGRGRLTWQARAVGQLVHQRRGRVGVRIGGRRASLAVVRFARRVAPAPVLRREHARL